MQRDLGVLSAVFFLLLLNSGSAEGRVCGNIDVRNSFEGLEKLRNCSIIMGHLHIVLIETAEDGNIDAYSFPELTDIVDYLLFFRIAGVTTLAKLFPNLKAIWGRKLFVDYSLVIYSLPNLQEIGLKSLQHIGRGAIKIDWCPNLCYVNTIDWQSMGAWMLDFAESETATCSDQFCPNDCERCWNKNYCQKSPSDFCQNFEDDGDCVKSCPKTKVTHASSRRCMTKELCETMVNGTWWVYNDTCVDSCPLFYNRDEKVDEGCVYVGENYSKVCEGGRIDSRNALEEMIGCTHIDGYLELRISRHYTELQLEESLGNVVSISEFLKIGRSQAITSLNFLKNLTIIKGETLDNNQYSLFVYENENLQKLWNFDNKFNLTISKGLLGFHDNPRLCLSEINKLTNLSGISLQDLQVSQYTNGYKSVCNQKDMLITILENNPTNVTISWQQINVTDNETIIGYTVFYAPVLPGNVTKMGDKNECSDENSDGKFILDNKIQLKELLPYTRYEYYIKTYYTLPVPEQTPLYHFVTASTEPSEPEDFTAEASSESSIVLEWSPPQFLNGHLSHYSIAMFVEEDFVPLVQQRDYCDYPHVFISEEEPKAFVNISEIVSNCSCPETSFMQMVTENLTCTEGGNKIDNCIKTIYQHQPVFVTTGEFNDSTVKERKMWLNEREIKPNETTYEFENLQYYTLYVFHLRACNLKTDTGELQCSHSAMVAQRTKRKKLADLIRSLDVVVDRTSVRLKWPEPQETNSLLVAYQIEYKRTDTEHSKYKLLCVTREEFQNYGYEFKILDLSPAKYAIRVQAVSLAGAGVFTEWKPFEIATEDFGAVVIYGPILAIVFVAVALGLFFVWYKKNKFVENMHLITSINPDYAGPIYEEDEWEIERSDIEMGRCLGQGSFGMVYEGLIKSRQCHCAIKTISENASWPSKMEFLNEGSVMKTFSDAHHVIRLLGIVSRGPQPLVVMELMERGDLKTYLRRCREPSQNLTMNEIYRMAAEIADGMAYLAAKKFVHRDLAARNCMVASDRTVKIGDFGMARDIYETDYYRKDTVGLLPVRWMAPESLADGVFTSDSDVWSYGIVLWEMATLAEQPYQGLSNEQVFHLVTCRRKLGRPPECSDLLYKIMDACWKWRPNDRPTFFDIVNELVDHVGEAFRLVAFCFSRQGRELRLNAGPRVYNAPAMTTAPDDDFLSHYDPLEEEVSLYVNEPNRPSKILPFSNQRTNTSAPYQLSPPSPTFSLNSS